MGGFLLYSWKFQRALNSINRDFSLCVEWLGVSMMPSPLPPLATDELFQNYPAGLLYFATAACIVFILVGIPGNLITIIALARCKKVSVTNSTFSLLN